MVIDQFHTKSIPVPEAENNPPVSLDRDTPATLQLAFQRV
jgi:hypothetical protein